MASATAPSPQTQRPPERVVQAASGEDNSDDDADIPELNESSGDEEDKKTKGRAAKSDEENSEASEDEAPKSHSKLLKLFAEFLQLPEVQSFRSGKVEQKGSKSKTKNHTRIHVRVTPDRPAFG